MSSIINYRFRSQADFSKIIFEGTSLPLWEFKLEIINTRKMTSKDFDLLFFDNDSNEEIVDEYYPIPRNSFIIVHRIPLWMSKHTYTAREHKKAPSLPLSKSKSAPPDTYVCFRCGNKGHYIQQCPTNQDKSFDITRIRKPSGIPKDFLIPVSDKSTSMLVTQEGGYVMAQPQTHEWSKVTQSISGHVPKKFVCGICGSLLNNPMRTNCNHVFCRACIRENVGCAVCGSKVTEIRPDETLCKLIREFME